MAEPAAAADDEDDDDAPPTHGFFGLPLLEANHDDAFFTFPFFAASVIKQ